LSGLLASPTRLSKDVADDPQGGRRTANLHLSEYAGATKHEPLKMLPERPDFEALDADVRTLQRALRHPHQTPRAPIREIEIRVEPLLHT
jgi:hypothetical protein